MPGSAGPVLVNVQALRAVAAYMVVAHHIANNLAHYTASGRFPELPGLGARGVDIFFVLSAFLVVTRSDRQGPSPGAFLVQRIVRIVPIYWLLTGLAALGIAGGYRLFDRGAITPDALLAALFFLPDFTELGAVRRPILVVGWTLNYEMAFYLLFALCLLAPRRGRVALACGALALLWLAQVSGAGGLAGYWGADSVLAFALGMLLARSLPSSGLAPALAIGAMLAGAAGLCALEVLYVPVGLPHPDLWGAMLAALVVLGAVALERRGITLRAAWLHRQGDASYAIYLVHVFVLQFVSKAWKAAGLTQSVAGLVVMVALMVVLVPLVSLAFHRHVEVPLTRYLRGRGRLSGRGPGLAL